MKEAFAAALRFSTEDRSGSVRPMATGMDPSLRAARG